MANPSWCKKGGARGYIVARPILWEIGAEDSGWFYQVPAGFEFESSVPRFLHWIFSPDDPHFLKAAAIHDHLLEAGFRRPFCDSQWFEAALSEGAPALRARLAYTGMRAMRFAQWALRA